VIEDIYRQDSATTDWFLTLGFKVWTKQRADACQYSATERFLYIVVRAAIERNDDVQFSAPPRKRYHRNVQAMTHLKYCVMAI
jgi:hypothetical protein